MENEIVKLIKQMQGSTLGVGLDSDKMKEAIQNNNNINICYLLDTKGTNKRINFNKKKFSINHDIQKINIKKIKKIFKKKRIENIICNYKMIDPFLKTFIRDSVYINKGKIYLYGPKNKLETAIDRYKRYTDNIKIMKKDNEFLLIIDNQTSKNNWLKDKGYWWVDTFNKLLDYLTMFLAN